MLWARYTDAWVSLGVFDPDQTGAARMIVESPGLAELPTALQVTEEVSAKTTVPSGAVVIQWPG